MQLCIYTHGIELTEAIKRQAYEKLDLALDRLESDIVSIRVFLTDTNGPMLGGIDKACRIIVMLSKQDSIMVEDIDESVDVVLDRTTDRLGVVACKRANLWEKSHKRWRLDEPDDHFNFN